MSVRFRTMWFLCCNTEKKHLLHFKAEGVFCLRRKYVKTYTKREWKTGMFSTIRHTIYGEKLRVTLQNK